MQNLGTLPGAFSSTAYGVSGDGSVVVGVAGGYNFYQAFHWTAVDGMVSLGLPPGEDYRYSRATAVTADGSVVVGDGGTHSGHVYAFRWTAAGGMQDLGTHPDGRFWSASGVSGDGSVVVGTIDPECGCRRASLWTSSLGVVDLNAYLPTLGVDLTGWSLGKAIGISADGLTIVGDGDFNGAGRGWVVTLISLPALPADFNNDDSVDAADYVVWRKGLGATYDQDDYDAWRTNFGQTVPGSGSSSAFSLPPSAFDSAVPEPSMLILAAVCFVATLACRQPRLAAQ
jgi:probable HAF family extracellular repeat protein